MRLKLTLQRSSGVTDLLVTCDAATTVGDLADHLRRSDPTRTPANPAEHWSLAVPGGRSQLLNPRTPLAESGMRSGAIVTLTPAGAGSAALQLEPVASAEVLSGPDQGRTFALASGSNLIGREADCTVRLSDPLVSRRHARLNLTDEVEIIDLGSSNGVLIGGAAVERAPLPSDQTAQLGDTVIAVRMHRRPSTEGRQDAVAVGFIRSPRLLKPYDGETFEAPDLPTPPSPQRFPLIGLIVPVILGVGLYLLTKNIASLLFVALSPLMLVGSYLEQRLGGRAVTKRQRKLFFADVDIMLADVGRAAEQEIASRLAEHPSGAEGQQAARQQSPLLWTRRPGEAGFAEFRLGLGELPSRSTISLPDGRRGPRDLHAALVEKTAPFRTVRGVPAVAAPLAQGALGIAGARTAVVGAAGAVLAQAVTLHSPTDLVLVGVASAHTARDWDWLKWLPHCGSAASPLTSPPLASTPSEAAKLIGELESLVAERAEVNRRDEDPAPPPTILLVVESDAPAEFSRLVGLAETGWRQGVIVLWIAPETALLPAACRVFLELSGRESGRAGYLHSGDLVTPVLPDQVTPEELRDLGRRMAPMVDLAARGDDASDLPRTVSLLSLAGPSLAESSRAVIEKWAESRSIAVSPPYARPTGEPGNLRAIIGMSAGEVHAIDLRAQGPHALVGGTTGSGKSELLQTWILAMALNHSPQRLTFLLVDYKGGAAFAGCKDLPHTVGLVTDLNPKGVRRALESLRAELRYREHILNSHKVKDLIELEKLGVVDTPPSLVIVVDEFAALVTEVPEFVDGVVDVAQRGRSLGLHLILATQRPGGVIKGNLRANTNLRLALRVADVDDSQDVVGSPQAAYFDQDVPGRAVSKTGPGRLVPFQAAYVGGHTRAEATQHDIEVEELRFGPPQRWEPLAAAPGGPAEQPVDPGPNDLNRLVATLNDAATAAELPQPREPWKAELASFYNLSDRDLVPNRRVDRRLVFGLKDDPEHQQQIAAAFEPDAAGNLAVFGTGGSGKSTLLRTLAVTAGFTIRGGRSQVYGIDFGSHGLDLIAGLPHVGSIIAGTDDERIRRLLTMLGEVVEERAGRYARAKADSITAYRQLSGRSDEPRILLLIDGIAGFRSAYESTAALVWWERLVSIAQGGRAVGVHVIVSADRAAALPSTLAATIQQRIVLRMADPMDYDLLGVPKDVLDEKSPPGRGIDRGLEVQVAVLGDAPDAASQAAALEELGQLMLETGTVRAAEIQRLPEELAEATVAELLRQRPAEATAGPCPGLRSTTLLPFAIPTNGSFLVTGPLREDRAPVLLAIAHATRRWRPGRRLVLLGHRRSTIGQRSAWDEIALGPTEVAATLGRLNQQLRALSEASADADLTVVVDGLLELSSTELDGPLLELIKLCESAGAQFVWDADPSAISTGPYTLMTPLKLGRTGLALQPDPGDGNLAFKTPFPTRLPSADFPTGRGLLVANGRTEVVQIMQPSA